MAKRVREDPRDEVMMALALEEAAKGLGHTAPNPPVGCVIARGSRVLGKGYHRRAGKPHAEVEALADCGSASVRGATAYVTLEPCSHYGRTPPCANALVEAGVARVVVGVRDPNPEVAGKGIAGLRRAGIEVRTGVLKKRCRASMRGYLHWVETKTPWVHMKLAASLDGRIAARTGASKWITTPASRRRVQDLRARCDGILVGVGTVRADDPRLTARVRGARDPLRIVLDRRAEMPARSGMLSARGDTLVVVDPSAPAAAKRRLVRAGAELLEIRAQGRAGWKRLLGELGKRGLHELLIEGGSAVAAGALKARVVNSMTIFYNPRLIGGDGVPLVGPLGVASPDAALRLETDALETCGEDIVWTGRVLDP